MDRERFARARAAVIGQSAPRAGIGTLGEKTLHAVVKHYLDPDPLRQERRLGSYVVDIYDGEQAYEIQTGAFGRLRAKLTALLPDYQITIVYPMPARKWLLWVDPQTGEVSRRRLSPRRGRFTDIMPELYRIRPFLGHPHLSLLILRIDMEEYRLLNGWSQDRKKGSSRDERLPLDLVDELRLDAPEDFRQLLPRGLPDPFSSADLAHVAAISRRLAQTVLNILLSMQIVQIGGRRGRSRLYGITPGCGRMDLVCSPASSACSDQMKG